MVLVDKDLMPKTHEELKQWIIEKSREKNYLLKTDVAEDVFNIIGGGPVPHILNPFGHLFLSLLLTLYQKNLKKFMESKIQSLKNFWSTLTYFY